MKPYEIQHQQIKAAKSHDLTIRPSEVRGKKIDVYQRGKKIASIGARGYDDYWTLINQGKRGKAGAKRRNFLARSKSWTEKFSPGWLAREILW